MSDSLRPHGLYSPWNSLSQNTGVGGLSLLQGIFPVQGLNPGHLHCRQILYQLSQQNGCESKNLKTESKSRLSPAQYVLQAKNGFYTLKLLEYQ